MRRAGDDRRRQDQRSRTHCLRVPCIVSLPSPCDRVGSGFPVCRRSLKGKCGGRVAYDASGPGRWLRCRIRGGLTGSPPCCLLSGALPAQAASPRSGRLPAPALARSVRSRSIAGARALARTLGAWVRLLRDPEYPLVPGVEARERTMSQDAPTQKDNPAAFRAALDTELEVELEVSRIDWPTGELAEEQREALAAGDRARAAELEEQIRALGRRRKTLRRGGTT